MQALSYQFTNQALTPPTLAPKRRRSVLGDRFVRNQANFTVLDQNSAQRDQIETFIANRYFEQYGAQLYSFLPQLLTMHCGDTLSAAVGIGAGYEGRLFIDQYFDKPIEQVLAQESGHRVQRDQVAEIGNLAAQQRGASQLLFLVLADSLHKAAFEWLVFAGTEQVAKLVSKLHCPFVDLGPASPERIGSRASQWGTYYNSKPRIMAINLRLASALARTNTLQNFVLQAYEDRSEQMAISLGQKNCTQSYRD